MQVPETVTTALEDLPAESALCLEAGAGVGNATAGLLAAGADHVYAVTDDPEDAESVRGRFADDSAKVSAVVGDLREIPLPDDAVEVITAHGLCNVLAPEALDSVVAELTRVAAPEATLVVDDYDPLPDDAAMRAMFAVENAAAELADERPALTFYPSSTLRRVFEGAGWTFERERTLLDPVPWTESHVAAHADVARSIAADLPDAIGESLRREADRLEAEIGSESAGRMYSLAFRLSASG